MGWYGFRPYVPVATRRARASAYGKKLAQKEGRSLAPVEIEGRKITQSFWGQAWCENLERYSDFANRLPRGRTYVRNGSVIDLQISAGKVKALVSGSEVYTVTIAIDTLAKNAWQKVVRDCSQSIESLIDLLQARFDQGIMQRLSRQGDGLFPSPKEIKMRCSCPDWAGMCKHVAATMYGVGARLDSAPELLFTLRAVDHLELIGQAVAEENLQRTLDSSGGGSLAGSDLGEMFGIELDTGDKAPGKRSASKKAPVKKSAVKKDAVKKDVVKKDLSKKNPVSNPDRGAPTIAAAKPRRGKRPIAHAAEIAVPAPAGKPARQRASAKTRSSAVSRRRRSAKAR